jgi:hypothetical protein
MFRRLGWLRVIGALTISVIGTLTACWGNPLSATLSVKA